MRRLWCGALMALLSSPAFAATRTWTGTTNGTWTVAANWGGTAPVFGDDLVFPATGANQVTTNDLTSGTFFNSITLSGGAYTLGGNAIQLGAGGVIVSGGTTQTISLPITLLGSQTWQLTAASTVTGAIDLGGAALTIFGAGAAGIVIGGPVTGSGSITSTQTPFLEFAGTSTTLAPILSNGTLLGFFNDSAYPGAITVNGQTGGVAIGKGATVGNVTVNGPLGEFIGGISSGGPPNGIAHTGNLTLRNATLYLEEIDSATDYAQVSVSGTVDVSGALLQPIVSSPVPAGTQFTIIQNDGTDPVVGTFIGSPQGGNVTMLGTGGQVFTIDYHGGDGNDVVITAQNPITTLTTTTVNTTAPPAVSQPVTITATVTPNSGTAIPTGTVSFLAVTFTGPSPVITVLGSTPLDGSGVATLTATLPPTTDSIIAFYGGSGVFGGSEGGLAVTLAGSIPTLDPRALVILAVALAAVGALVIKLGE